jgi:histidine phosphotransferase ChpT
MSGTDGALRLIELTSARLCHDISGIVGTLDDVLSVRAQSDADTERMASDAAQALTTLLELRRAAWGPVDVPISLTRIQRLASGLPDQVDVDVSALKSGTVFSASVGRVVLNLLLLAADSLPSGGTVVLAGEPDDLFVRIAGPTAAWPPGMAVCLADETEARSALTDGRSLQMALTALLARAAGTRLSVLLSPTARNEPSILRLGG